MTQKRKEKKRNDSCGLYPSFRVKKEGVLPPGGHAHHAHVLERSNHPRQLALRTCTRVCELMVAELVCRVRLSEIRDERGKVGAHRRVSDHVAADAVANR